MNVDSLSYKYNVICNPYPPDCDIKSTKPEYCMKHCVFYISAIARKIENNKEKLLCSHETLNDFWKKYKIVDETGLIMHCNDTNEGKNE